MIWSDDWSNTLTINRKGLRKEDNIEKLMNTKELKNKRINLINEG